MKKILAICVFALMAITAQAQKFALMDMEYVLKNIPAYERANEQLNQVSKKWQAEVEALNTQAANTLAVLESTGMLGDDYQLQPHSWDGGDDDYVDGGWDRSASVEVPAEPDMDDLDPSYGVIGGADGPTAIFITAGFPWGLLFAILGCIALVILGIIMGRRPD